MFLLTSFLFTSTILSVQDVLLSHRSSNKYSGQIMTKNFDLDNQTVNCNLKLKGCIDLKLWNDYHLDSGTCTLTCIHDHFKRLNIKIRGIICDGICFTQSPILPTLY